MPRTPVFPSLKTRIAGVTGEVTIDWTNLGDPNKAVSKILDLIGAVNQGGGKHVKWKLPNGMTFTIAKTPSDYRAGMNQLALLKRMLIGNLSVPAVRDALKGITREEGK